MVGASAETTEAAAAPTSVSRMTFTRPTRSDSIPHTGCIAPYSRKYAVAASVTRESDTSRSSEIATSMGAIDIRSNAEQNAAPRMRRSEPGVPPAPSSIPRG